MAVTEIRFVSVRPVSRVWRLLPDNFSRLFHQAKKSFGQPFPFARAAFPPTQVSVAAGDSVGALEFFLSF